MGIGDGSAGCLHVLLKGLIERLVFFLRCGLLQVIRRHDVGMSPVVFIRLFLLSPVVLVTIIVLLLATVRITRWVIEVFVFVRGGLAPGPNLICTRVRVNVFVSMMVTMDSAGDGVYAD